MEEVWTWGSVLFWPGPTAGRRRESAAMAAFGSVTPRRKGVLNAQHGQHRIVPAWVYGFAENGPGEDARIAQARGNVANPGMLSDRGRLGA